MKQRLHLIALGATVLLPLLVFSSAMVFLFDRQQQDQIERMLSQVARTLSDSVERQLSNHVSSLEALATSIHLDTGNIADFSIEAQRLLDSRPEFMSMRLRRAADVALLAAVFPSDVRDNVPLDQLPPPAAQEQIREVVSSKRPTVSDLHQIPGGEPFISVVVPVMRDGEVRFILSANLRSRAIGNALTGPALPENWIGSVLDRNRIILARNRRQDEFVGKLATESLRHEIERAANSFFFARSIEGQEMYSAFTTSPLSGWTVAVGAPGEAVAGPQHRALLAVAAGGLAALTATIGLAALLIGSALRRQAMERRLMALEGERLVERRLSDVAANLPGVIFRRVEHPDGTVRYPYVSAGLSGPTPLLPSPKGPGENGPGENGVGPDGADAGGDELAQLLHPDDRAVWATAFAVAASGEPSHLEVRTADGDGRVRWVRVMARASPPSAVVEGRTWDGVALDVTDLKEIQERLTAALDETQTLLMEVHHRVKNNLQVVWSLVQLEAMQIDHPAARQRMEIIGQRINVMGRIHEQVYSQKEFARIDFALQLRSLAERLKDTHGRPEEIRLAVSGERLFCSLDTAIPLALIANEIISNAVGHAFPPESRGTIRVDLRTHAEGAALTVADDGIGMVSSRSAGGGSAGRGLGMRLVKALVGQLGARMIIDSPADSPVGSLMPTSEDGPDPGGGTGGTRVTIIVPGPWYAD
jgi:two-component sensor histidine kinase/PAS domain-containing protein